MEIRKELEQALNTVSKEDIEIPEEETDIVCEKCGAKMIVQSGRFGKFARPAPIIPNVKTPSPLTKMEIL